MLLAYGHMLCNPGGDDDDENKNPKKTWAVCSGNKKLFIMLVRNLAN